MLAAALLAGDLCISAAYDLVATATLPAHHRIACLHLISRAMRTTIAGELLDTYGDSVPVAEANSLVVAELKTATYSFIVPLLAGAQLAGADPTMITHLEKIGASLGLSFQLVDDDLGAFGDPEEAGKSSLSDLRAGKRTELLRFTHHLSGPSQRAQLDALVGDRLLDEDGAATVRQIMEETGGREVLDDLERETHAAISRGFSANLTVHAFAAAAARCGFGPEQLDPFFVSMRMDLEVTVHDEASFRRYIFGSAEVVGEMCLAAFLNREAPAPLPEVAREGARRLGAAYQKVNFLRDLGFDADELGRAYIPTATPGLLTDDEMAFWMDDTAADLAAARASLPLLPWRARLSVRATYELYRSLHRRLSKATPAQLHRRRIRVPDPVKVLLLLKAIAATAVGR